MELEMLKTNPRFLKDTMEGDISSKTLNLSFLVKKLKCSPSWENGELDSIILLKSSSKKIVLTALHEGTEIVSFQSNDSITFQLIEGELMVHTDKISVTINKGQFLTLHDKINYSLTTSKETVFLLTISNSILQPAEN